MQAHQQAEVGTTASPSTVFTVANVHVLPPMFSPEQIRDLLQQKTVRTHHEDDGHNTHAKTLQLPWVAQAIWPFVATLDLGRLRPFGVDEMMKVYRLGQGAGAVSPHRDEDFDGPDGVRALHSIIVRLNDGYEGGETMFNRTIPAPHVEVGGGLFFPHSLLHEGRAVTRGVKFVLKTDLFVR